MALPKWLTPAGNLGIVPELDYYEFPLDAYDATGGTLEFNLVSGSLPLGLQIISTGKIAGIPVSSKTTGDQNEEYTFTIRVKNLSSGYIADRTFFITITNVAPPIIVPKSSTRLLILGGNAITANVGNYISQESTGANAVVLGNVSNSTSVTIRYISSSLFAPGASSGNLKINGVSYSSYPVNTQTTEYYLGLYLDGTEVSYQLEAIEFTPGAPLTWKLKNGELPDGLTLTADGLITGYIIPIEPTTFGSEIGWGGHRDTGDAGYNISTNSVTNPSWYVYGDVITPWSYIGWDAPLNAISKTFTFTIEVSDGVNYDLTTYTLTVYPRDSLTADNDDLPVDTTTLESGVGLTIDYGNKHNPIIITSQANLIPVRQSSYFSFNVDAIDLDGEILNYSAPAIASGAFDEQTLVGEGTTYVASTVSANILYAGIYPYASSDTISTLDGFSQSTRDFTNINFEPNTEVKIIDSNNQWRLANVTGVSIIRLTGNTIPNVNVGNYLIQDSSGANAIISNVSATTGTLTMLGNIVYGNIITTGTQPIFNISLSGNIRANVGDFITQPSTSSNATVTANTVTYIQLAGANSTSITANVGDYITQVGTSGNAVVLERSVNSSIVYVEFLNTSFNTTNSANIRINGTARSNVYPISTVTASNVVTVLYTTGSFINNSSGWISKNGANVAVYPTANVKVPNNILVNANVGDIITQVSGTGNATVLGNARATTAIHVVFNSGTFNINSGNVLINGNNANVYVTDLPSISRPFAMRANVGQYITQTTTGANARVTANVIYSTIIPVEFLSNTFTVGSGNLKLNGANLTAYPSNVVCRTDVTATYVDADTWDINGTTATSIPKVHSGNVATATTINGNITALVGVGVTVGGLATEGTNGFDETKFDQGQLQLPAGLSIDLQTGWITGQLPPQTVDKVEYDFEIVSYKRDDPTYQDRQLYTLTILGDLNNRIDWVTATDLGSIVSGTVSDLSIEAVSTLGKTVIYELTPNATHRLPQGLILTRNGLISGRVSFELFGLDSGTTTLDKDKTTFDQTYRFSATARDITTSTSATKEFTIKVRAFTKIPYEDLYLKALPTVEQRALFSDIVNDTSIFPIEKIYRSEDPYFGISKSIRSLFLPGLSPSTLAEYIQAASTNHFSKRFLFAGIKTAQVLDENFNVKYEVVYLQLDSENDIETSLFTHANEIGPSDVINLSGVIENAYFDQQGNAYTTAYPNSTQNMESMIIGQIGYENKGALPDWMTSRQADGRQLGFVHAVVLAYTKPGESNLIAYRLKQREFNFNSIDFTVDRYHLDNKYSENYDISANAFVTSTETTFDRYPSLSSTITNVGTVDFASTSPFEEINNRYLDEIRASGGIDGVLNIRNGMTLVFATQEFYSSQGDISDRNQGWANVKVLWDDESWAYNIDTTDNDYQLPPPGTNADNTDTTPGQPWDDANYVPGFVENNLNPSVTNQRIGIWQVNINEGGLVQLEFIQSIDYYNKVYVRNGFSYGGTNIYYDPIVKLGNTVPNYSIIPQEIRTSYTKFDGNGTRFFDYRDEYTLPESGDKYIKFTKLGVFT